MGLHTGRRSSVRVEPAPPGTGLVFQVRLGGAPHEVPARWDHRAQSRMCTALRVGGGHKLRTVEHLLAALSGMGLDNARIEIEGPEVPILDGSARPWCDLIVAAGIEEQPATRTVLAIRRPFEIAHFGSFIRAEPHEGLAFDLTTDQLPGFGTMRWHGSIDPQTLRREIAPARSFGTLDNVLTKMVRHPLLTRTLGSPLTDRLVRRIKARGFRPGGPADEEPVNRPTGASPGDVPVDLLFQMVDAHADPILRAVRPSRAAIIVGGRVIGGARYRDEPIRHKAVDMLGDLALAGHPLRGRFVAHAPTHALTYAFVGALMRSDAWELT